MPQFMPILSADKQDKINNYLRSIDNLRNHYEKTKALLFKLDNAVVFNELKNMPKEKQEMIDINYTDFVYLKRLYANALENKKEIITFKGRQLLVTYAKYLIEYLQTKFQN